MSSRPMAMSPGSARTNDPYQLTESPDGHADQRLVFVRSCVLRAPPLSRPPFPFLQAMRCLAAGAPCSALWGWFANQTHCRDHVDDRRPGSCADHLLAPPRSDDDDGGEGRGMCAGLVPIRFFFHLVRERCWPWAMAVGSPADDSVSGTRAQETVRDYAATLVVMDIRLPTLESRPPRLAPAQKLCPAS